MVTWLKRLMTSLSGLIAGPDEDGPLYGMVLRPFDDDPTEPYRTFSCAVEKQLKIAGVRFDPSGDEQCLLDWEFLGGAKLRLRAALKIGDILVTENVREGLQFREEVDFDIDDMMAFDLDAKKEKFLIRAAEKLVLLLGIRHHRDLNRLKRLP